MIANIRTRMGRIYDDMDMRDNSTRALFLLVALPHYQGWEELPVAMTVEQHSYCE